MDKEIMKRFLEKAGDKAEEILSQIQQCPPYFINEGGSDGTLGHVNFHLDYGYLMPEIVEIADDMPRSSQEI